jgi:hypothetical protein
MELLWNHKQCLSSVLQYKQTISNYLVGVAIISCDFKLKTDTNYQHVIT